ncbi:MAG: metal-dependent hydrolase, partial [Cyanobacteria bacterium P01_D01_bin.56]
MVLKLGLAFLGSLALAFAVFYFWATSGSYPSDNYTAIFNYDVDSSMPEADETLSLVSYNIGYLSGLTNLEAVARPKTLFDDNLEQAIAALKPLNPDIIAFQEIDIASNRSYNVNQ